MILNYHVKVYLFKWIIIFCIAAAGQGKEVQTLLMPHEDSDSGLPTASELNSHFTMRENDLLGFPTDDFFPKKLEKSFQKHRLKFNVKDFSFTPLYNSNFSSTLVPILENSSKSSATFAFHENENYESSHNNGHEEEDNDDEEDLEEREMLKNIMDNVILDDIRRIQSKINNESASELTGTELMRTPGENYKNNNHSAEVTGESNIDGKMNIDAEIELLKIKNGSTSTIKNNQSENNNHISIQSQQPSSITFPSSSFPFEHGEFIESLDTVDGMTESLRIIPQLVNVTTENVYVSLESDEDIDDQVPLLEDDPKKRRKDQLDDNTKDSQLEQFPTEPPFITVNSSGIFPQSNLSSHFRDLFSKHSKRKHHHQNSIFNNVNPENEQVQNENSGPDPTKDDDFNGSQEDEEGEEDDGQGKTMMMRRRPRRSVVHLYDMVVCATGCNPLIYKGYGCFCGFMGSGITVDGIDKCCYKHDWCYHHAKCPPLLTYFVPYYWTCNGGRPKCVSDFRGWKGICGAHLCECDRQFAECLRKYPCPRSRAMCMTSPWRFWQNIVMPHTSHYGR